jgi:hypothetical protein
VLLNLDISLPKNGSNIMLRHGTPVSNLERPDGQAIAGIEVYDSFLGLVVIFPLRPPESTGNFFDILGFCHPGKPKKRKGDRVRSLPRSYGFKEGTGPPTVGRVFEARGDEPPAQQVKMLTTP